MDKPNLVKTCSSCGLQKPLASFLQFAGSESASYGNICADCRKAHIDNEIEKEPDEFSTNTSGYKIDSKAHLHGEIEKKEHHHKVEELNKTEHDKAEVKKEKRIRKIIDIQKGERDHRKNYLEKSSFLTTQHSEAQQRALEEKQKLEEESKIQAVKQEEKLKRIDFSETFLPSQTGAQVKLQGRIFSDFKAWLGGSAPVVRSMDPSAQTPEQKNIKIGTHRELINKEKNSGESLEKDIENTFKPFSKNT